MSISVNWTPWAIVEDRITRNFIYKGYNEDGTSDELTIEIIPSRNTKVKPKKSLFSFKKKTAMDMVKETLDSCPNVFLILSPGEGYPVDYLECVLCDNKNQPLMEAIPLRVMQSEPVLAMGFKQVFDAYHFVKLLAGDRDFVLQIRCPDAVLITIPLPYESGLYEALNRF